MTKWNASVRRAGARLAALGASVLTALLPTTAAATCPEHSNMCTGRYQGYVGTRAPITRDGQKIWAERAPDGTQQEVQAATGPYENARPLAAADAAAQIQTYANRYSLQRLMTRAEYTSFVFRRASDQIPLLAPPLLAETTHVSVQQESDIHSPADIVLFEYNLDPRRAAPSPATGTLLLDANGVELRRSVEGSFNYLSDFINSRGQGRGTICGGAVGDLLSFEHCPAKAMTLLAPLRGVRVDSSSHHGFGDAEVTTDHSGHYFLDYRYAGDELLFFYWGHELVGSFPVGPLANARDNFWVYMRYNQLEPRIKLGGLHIEERQTRGGTGSPVNDVQHVGIEVSMLVGTGILANEPRGERWSGEVPAGPIPIDDVSGQTAYAYTQPPPPPPPPPPDPNAPPPDPDAPPKLPPNDLKDRGFLQQINRTDLSNTDVYVFDLAGNLLTERNGLKANETDGLVCATPNSCTLPPGDYQAKFHFQGIVKDPGFDRRVKIVIVNRATGYIGTGFANKRDGTLPMLVAERDIVLRPPNLTVVLKRTRKDEQENLIGFEGSALLTDTLVEAHTVWSDWDGTALPANLPGFTGRIARVVEPNRLQPDSEAGGSSGSGLFPIRPGHHTTIVKVPNASDLAHLYLHVNGKPPEKTPDFSERTDGSGLLRYRPSRYVPFKVMVFDNPGDIGPDEDLEQFYVDVYRPEHHFSFLDLDARNLDIVTENARTNLLDDVDALITGDIESIEFIYNLIDPNHAENNPLPELERFGEERTYVITIGGVEKKVTIGVDGSVTWDSEDFGGDINPSELIGVRLVQAGDEGNILEEYGLTLKFRVTPDIAEGFRQISADEALAEVEAEVMIGFKPVDPGAEVRWQFTQGSGGLSTPTTPTDKHGMTSVTFDTSRVVGEQYELTGFLDKVRINGKEHVLDPPWSATTSTFLVVAGAIPPENFAATSSRPTLPADGKSTATVTFHVRDAWGNIPSDGTPVTWVKEGPGGIEGAEQLTGGAVTGTFTAPVYPSRPAVRVIVGGSRSPPAVFDAGRLYSGMSADQLELHIGSGDTATLTATFKDGPGPDAQPIAAGSEVTWTASNGDLLPLSSFTDANGVARAELTVPKEKTQLGPIHVRATVAGHGTNSPAGLKAVTSESTSVEISRSMLVFKTGAFTAEEPVRNLYTESTIGKVEAIPVFSETPVVITGAPGQRPLVSLQDFGVGPLLTVDGLNPDGTATIASDGKARLTIRRRTDAPFAFAGLTGPVPHALLCTDFDADGTCEWENKVAAVNEEAARSVGSYVWGFVTGQTDDISSTAGDITASFFMYGDLRDIAVTYLQLYGVVPGEPNPVVVSLAALSLIPLPGLEQLAAVVKAIARRLPANSRQLAVLVEMVFRLNKGGSVTPLSMRRTGLSTQALGGIVSGIPWTDMLKVQLELADDEFRAFSNLMVDDDLLDTASKVFNRLKLPGVEDNPLGRHLVRSLAQRALTNPAAFNDTVARYLLKTLDAVDEQTLQTFVSLTTHELDEVIESLAKLPGKVDPYQLGRALSNPRMYGVGYTQKHLLKDLGDLADVPGLESTVKMLKVDANQVHGFKYEIQVAAKMKRAPPRELAGCTVGALSQRMFTDALGQVVPLKTDIDITMNCSGKKIALQVKRGAGALGSLSSVKRWVERAKKGVGGQVDNLMYVLPPGTTIRKDIADYFRGPPVIPVIRVEELNPFT